MIKIFPREPFPPGVNPFNHDSYHMGITIGTNVTIMMANHADKHCHYMIVINAETGERIRVEFDGELPDGELPDEAPKKGETND